MTRAERIARRTERRRLRRIVRQDTRGRRQFHREIRWVEHCARSGIVPASASARALEAVYPDGPPLDMWWIWHVPQESTR